MCVLIMFFYADDLCLIAPCAIALQQLINVWYECSVLIDMSFNATKCYCVAFTPKEYNLALPSLHINHLSYTNSTRTLDIYFVVTTSFTDKLCI